ncbi:MAG: DUF4363 family protein [Clostridiales bacterium]|nr:DUF4363 family protein [Clostridiales bacterium]MCF8023628.1 DUF4363 family protein [Clostridiales bacterium]
MRIIKYAIPALVLLIFIFIMTGGMYFKEPLSGKDDFARHVEILERNLQEENWDKAGDNMQDLKTAWKNVIPRIQFSVERDKINEINISLARMEGAIEGKDRGGALSDLSEIKMYWNSLGR